jgi:8-oxo-dGTP pyrophosphatase MutT (NUDIX family)
MHLIKDIEKYSPYNQQELEDKSLILDHLRTSPNLFNRDNKAAHMTASAWVVNKDKTKVLMAYHNIYDSWSWLGGHADGEKDLLKVALQEVEEESGLSTVKPLSTSIYSLEVLTVDGHEKNGQYVSSHLHLNVTYLFEGDDQAPLSIKENENSDVAWFELDAAIEASTEPWFQQRIYTKLNNKLKEAAK